MKSETDGTLFCVHADVLMQIKSPVMTGYVGGIGSGLPNPLGSTGPKLDSISLLGGLHFDFDQLAPCHAQKSGEMKD